MIVQIRINIDDTSTTVEIPEVSVIRPNNGKIQLSLKRPISSTLNDKDYVTIIVTPDDNLEVINRGYGILVNRALIERVSL